jgi:hypothetical protein
LLLIYLTDTHYYLPYISTTINTIYARRGLSWEALHGVPVVGGGAHIGVLRCQAG